MPLSWPLTGRIEELLTVDAALSTPGVSGIVVHGAAGYGKSRIVREALSAAEARGWTARSAVGTTSARAIPLGAFTAWAPSGGTEPVQLLRGVIESLTAAAPGEPVVISVDDVHLLDDLSTFVVHQIVARRAAKVILTVLDGEPVPPGVQDIWKVGQFDRLHLQPLPLAETTRLLAETLGGPVDPAAAERLWKLTLGNVLYLCTIVEQEIADGRVRNVDGYWHWAGDPTVPSSLIELIESRIGAAPAAVGDVVDTLAVGEPIELEVLRTIAHPGAVEEAEAHGLISLQPTTAGIDVRLSHPIYAEVRRRRAPTTKLRRLRGLVATELAASGGKDEIHVLVRRASLSVDSDLTPDADLLTRGAHGAVWLANLSLADRLAEAAIRSGAHPEPDFIRAHALSWLGHGLEAETLLAGIDPVHLSDAERARSAFLRASNMLWALGNPARAKLLIDEAAHTVLPQNRSYIDAFLTVYWFAMDQPTTALATAANLALDELPPVVGAEVAWVLTTIDGDAGRVAAAVDDAETGYLAATRSFDAPHMRFNIADSHVSALVLAGRISDAADVAARVHRQSAILPGAAQLLGPAVAGRAALGASELRSACDLLEQPVTGLRVNHSLGWGFRYLIPRVTALAIRGRTAEAAAGLAALDDVQRPFRTLDEERSIAHAWVAAGQGAVSEAIAMLLSAAERAARRGRFAAEVLCRQSATQLGDRTSAPRLHELESIVEGPRVGVASRFATALRDDDAAQLADASGEFEHMGDLVAAMDSAAHASLAHRRKGKRGSALACASRADALADRCGASTPALCQASSRLPLTNREHEIVMLIREGLSNRAVADRLKLSPRTVESHIYRAMSKTGTTCREDLAALLPRGQQPKSPMSRRMSASKTAE